MIGGCVFLEAEVVNGLGPPRADALVPGKIGWDRGCARRIDPQGAPVEPERAWEVHLSAVPHVRSGGTPSVSRAVSPPHNAPRQLAIMMRHSVRSPGMFIGPSTKSNTLFPDSAMSPGDRHHGDETSNLAASLSSGPSALPRPAVTEVLQKLGALLA
jgi:hypothetical protein